MSGYIPAPGPTPAEGISDLPAYRTFIGRIARYVSPLIFFFRIGAVSELGAREFVARYRKYYFSLLTRLMLTKWLPFQAGDKYAENWSDNEEIELPVDGRTMKYYLRKGYVKLKKPSGEEVYTQAVWIEPYYNRDRLEAFSVCLDESWAPRITEGSPYVWRRTGTETHAEYGEVHIVEPMYEISRFMTKGEMDLSYYAVYKAEYHPYVEQVYKDLDRRILVDDAQAEAYYKAGILPESDYVIMSGFDPRTGFWMTPTERFNRLFNIAQNYIWKEDSGMWLVVRLWFQNARDSLTDYFEQVLEDPTQAPRYASATARQIYRLIKFQTWVDRSFEGPSGWFNRWFFEMTRYLHWYEPLAFINVGAMWMERKWSLVNEIPTLKELLGLTDEYFYNPEETSGLNEVGVTVVEGHLMPALPERITRETVTVYYPLKDEYGNRIILEEGQSYTIELEGQQCTAIYHYGKIWYLPVGMDRPREVEIGYFEVPEPNPYNKTVYIVEGFVCEEKDVESPGPLGTSKTVKAFVPMTDEEGKPIYAGYIPLEWILTEASYKKWIDPTTGEPIKVSDYVNQWLEPPKAPEWVKVVNITGTLELYDGREVAFSGIALELPRSDETFVERHAYITYTDPDTGKVEAKIFFYNSDEDKWIDTGRVAPLKIIDDYLYYLIPEGTRVYYLAKKVINDMYMWNQGMLLRWHIFNFLHFIYALFMIICHGDARELLTLLIMVYAGSSADDLNRIFGTRFSELEWQQVGQLLDVASDLIEWAARILMRWRRIRVMRGLMERRKQTLERLARQLSRLRAEEFAYLRYPNLALGARIASRYAEIMATIREELEWLAIRDPTRYRFPFALTAIQVGVWQLFNLASAVQVIEKARQQELDQLLEEKGWLTAYEHWLYLQHSEAREKWKGIFSWLSTLFSWMFYIVIWAFPIILAIGLGYLIWSWTRRAFRLSSTALQYIRSRRFRLIKG